MNSLKNSHLVLLNFSAGPLFLSKNHFPLKFLFQLLPQFIFLSFKAEFHGTFFPFENFGKFIMFFSNYQDLLRGLQCWAADKLAPKSTSIHIRLPRLCAKRLSPAAIFLRSQLFRSQTILTRFLLVFAAESKVLCCPLISSDHKVRSE